MKHEYMCRPREELQCVYITLENVEEFVKTYGVRTKNSVPLKYFIEYNNENVVVVYQNFTKWYIRINGFMVKELDGWNGYTCKEFAECYEITV